MRLSLSLVLVFVLTQLAGCYLFHRNSAFLQAKSTPAPVAPAGLTMRPAQELFPVPDLSPHAQTQVHHGKDELPPPQPLVLAAADQGPTQVPGAVVHWQLSLGRDGNGFPVLYIGGAGFDLTWDQLNQVAERAHLPVKDKDRSLALIYLHIAKAAKGAENVQMRLSRSVDNWQLALQNDDETPADAELSRALLQRIQKAWPATTP